MALVACSPSSDESAPGTNTSEQTQHLRKIPLVVRHGDGAPDTRLQIEVALTPEQQERGLMHRTDLKPGDGMLFPMMPPRTPSFWMKDTPTPLDVVFVGTDGEIEQVVARAKPNDKTPLFVDVPVSGVFELRGGDAKAFGISEGDIVNWGDCSSPSHPAVALDQLNFCPGR
ncbi:MAG: DUF192 domain-containing protein [Sphingobium sp.]